MGLKFPAMRDACTRQESRCYDRSALALRQPALDGVVLLHFCAETLAIMERNGIIFLDISKRIIAQDRQFS